MLITFFFIIRSLDIHFKPGTECKLRKKKIIGSKEKLGGVKNIFCNKLAEGI